MNEHAVVFGQSSSKDGTSCFKCGTFERHELLGLDGACNSGWLG
jgi:hypothetical protein